MIHEILPVGMLACNCSILGDEKTHEGMVVDPGGNLYIADAANHRVRKVTPTGTISTVAGNGHPGFSGDNGPAAAAQLNQPYDVAIDAAGNLYIADFGNQRVRAHRMAAYFRNHLIWDVIVLEGNPAIAGP